jgi:hypothetical protein
MFPPNNYFILTIRVLVIATKSQNCVALLRSLTRGDAVLNSLAVMHKSGIDLNDTQGRIQEIKSELTKRRGMRCGLPVTA